VSRCLDGDWPARIPGPVLTCITLSNLLRVVWKELRENDMARRVRDRNAREKLMWAQSELRHVRDNITPNVAPRVALRIRSLLKSVDGAIRNAERFEHAKTCA
jgi:hypothetical protein